LAPIAPLLARAAPFRSTAALAWLAFLIAPASAASAVERPVRVTIQAQPRFDGARSKRGEGSAREGTSVAGSPIEVSAELVSDTGAPIIGAQVAVALASGDRGASLRPCALDASTRPAHGDAPIRTGDGGRLCVRVSGAEPDDSLLLTFTGDAVQLPAAASIPLQPAPFASTLAFDAPSLELDLDQPTLKLRLNQSPSDDDRIPNIALSLHDGGRTIPLTTAGWSRSGNTLWFSIATEQLGAPGPARLIAQLVPPAGAPESPARAEAIALRVATVRLGAELGADESGGREVRVWTETRAPGAIPSGWVEATGAQHEIVASAPFVQGSARLAFGSSDASGEITLYYRSDDPWWLPGEPLLLSFESGSHRAPRRWPWLALLAPIGYICLRSLQRPAQRKTERRPLPKPRPSESVVELPVPLSGWVGSVSDAHDGQPIAGARVEALLPSFRGSEPHALTALADARGWFELPALQHPLPEGARLRVSAPLHSEVEHTLPPQGRVSITLTSRRRAVLRRLVRWARALGSPWVRGGEPTPGEIALIAARRGEPRTARWAEGIQAAAFGRAPVDEAVEAALREAEPAWQQTGSHQTGPRGDGHDD
jgi:hypothetical protein